MTTANDSGSFESALVSRHRAVLARIAVAALSCGRDPESVGLVAISKTHPAQSVEILAHAGQVDFGENYVQEALAKQEAVKAANLRWHFTGGLQKNKAKYVVGRFSLVHTVDNVELARALHNRALAQGIVQDALMQVNLGREAQKSGVTEEDAAWLAEEIAALGGLRLQGLMTLPPYDEDAETSRPYFAALRALKASLERRLGRALPHLSMGMSHDLEVAIAEGATLVRVGTDIFGARPALK